MQIHIELKISNSIPGRRKCVRKWSKIYMLTFPLNILQQKPQLMFYSEKTPLPVLYTYSGSISLSCFNRKHASYMHLHLIQITVTTQEKSYSPWQTTIVTNCHIGTVSSKMPRTFAILAQISAGKS